MTSGYENRPGRLGGPLFVWSDLLYGDPIVQRLLVIPEPRERNLGSPIVSTAFFRYTAVRKGYKSDSSRSTGLSPKSRAHLKTMRFAVTRCASTL